MPKHEPFSPKAIANRIKSKGLQKLKWYCQMCNKQCRDENGFKCHTTSEAHQRQLLLFADNPGQFLGDFSSDFEKGFMDILRRCHGTKRVHANQIYQEYIKDKEHVHMNATRWHTLSGFCRYLGAVGKATAELTEKGWYLTYIERDPEQNARMEKRRRADERELDEEERLQRQIREQVEHGVASHDVSTSEEEERKEFRASGSKISLSIGASSAPPKTSSFAVPLKSAPKSVAAVFKRKEASKDDKTAVKRIKPDPEPKKTSSGSDRLDYWLRPGIVVKVTTKRLGDAYYRKKAIVRQVPEDDRYAAVVEMLDGGDRIKIDQVHAETVLPQSGRQVVFVNGRHRGQVALMIGIDEASFHAQVRLLSGEQKGLVLDDVEYEDICKLHQT